MLQRIVLVVVLLGLAQASAGQCQYEAVPILVPQDLCPFGPPHLVAISLNDHGVVVGRVTCPTTGDLPCRWSLEPGLELMPMPPGAIGGATFRNINNDGVVSGATSANATGFRYDGDRFIFFPPAPSSASALNDLGDVGGRRLHPDGTRSGYVWIDGEYFDLGTHRTTVIAINNHRIAVGHLDAPSSTQRAFVWQVGDQIVELPTLPNAEATSVWDINDHGTIVGFAEFDVLTPKRRVEGIVWANGIPTSVGPGLPPGLSTTVTDVNNAEAYLGRHFIPLETIASFVMTAGIATDLTDLTPSNITVTHGRDINDHGQILTQAYIEFDDGTVDDLPVLLTPVDRPRGDANADCRVDMWDLELVIRDWGTTSIVADLDRDGHVGFSDLTIVLGEWSERTKGR